MQPPPHPHPVSSDIHQRECAFPLLPIRSKTDISPQLQLLGKFAVTSAFVNLVIRTAGVRPPAPPFNQTEHKGYLLVVPVAHPTFTGGTCYGPDYTHRCRCVDNKYRYRTHKPIYCLYLRRTGGASNIGTTTSTNVISFPKLGFESTRSSSVLVVTL